MSDSTTPTPTPVPPPVTPVVTTVTPYPAVTPAPAPLTGGFVGTVEGDVQTAVTDVEGLPTWAKVLIGVVVLGAVFGVYYLFHTGVL
jgi:hypothetical protein